MDPSHQQHRDSARGEAVRCAVITISDTRTAATDTSGGRIREALTDQGHAVSDYQLVPDEPAAIEPLVRSLCERSDVDAILLNGGTGIARRDRTYDVVAALLEKTLPGFGEIFRILSYEEVGAAAMLSRAIAGVRAGTLVFCMPGSTNAVELALQKLILPELQHLVWELRR
ncbi:MAG: MogA/MoaB family molybdenum cofactor biosynthesis protein [Armatimonadetes bacterium]|nr:MogA/MoaB family molybdenum cofactor biosynthesis protein [Armatimonadota bacterium]